MKKLHIFLAGLFFLSSLIFNNSSANCSAQTISTVAGNGTLGYSGDNAQATAAEIDNAFGVAFDAKGNLYIVEANDSRVRKVNTSGVISTVAGNGISSYSGDTGPATAAELNSPNGIAVDASGNLYISDISNYRIRKVNTSGTISTFAGNGIASYFGDGGQATAAEISAPSGLAVDASGNVYISDVDYNRVRKVNTSGVISTFVGNGTSNYSGDGGQATAAEISYPAGLVFDAAGNLYIADEDNQRIRIVNTSGVINTFAGNGTSSYSGDGGPATAAELDDPSGVAVDASGNIYIADWQNNRIRIVNSSGIISTEAGNGVHSYNGDGIAATAAELNTPYDVAINTHGNLFIADVSNYRIREVTSPGGAAPCNGWLQEASLTAHHDSGRSGAASFSIGHYGYIGCGALPTGTTNDFWRWNQVSNTWTAVAAYPGAGRQSMCSFSIGGYGYCCLGVTAANTHATDMWRYDTASNTWTQMTSFPGLGRFAALSFVIGTTAYVGGGEPGGTPYYEDVYAYNSLTNTWTAVANFGGGEEAGLVAFSLNGYGYAGCGTNGTNLLNTMYKYSPMSNTWTSVAALPIPGGKLNNLACFVIDTLAYVGTGESAVDKDYRDFWTYSATTNTWTPIVAIPGAARTSDCGFSIGSRGYIGMGLDSVNGYLNDFWQFGVCGSSLSVSATATANVTCAGLSNGAASATPSGGTSPYTYSWSPSGGSNATATGLSTGIYTINVKDNTGLTATASVTITQPTALAITLSSVSNVSCHGGTGSATANAATGGTSPYTYSWSGSGGTNVTATVSAGTYTITATDNHGCTATSSATLTQPASSLGITITSVTNVSCHGQNGSATASAATGGTSPYTYSWSGGGGTNLAATLSAGTYTITATDNHGCTATASATLTQPDALRIAISSVTNVNCNGGSGSVTASSASGGTSPYTYTWSGGGGTNLTAALSAGTYTITVIDVHGCSATATATITQPASSLGITLSTETNVTCNVLGSATANAATGGTLPYTYSWSGGRGTNLAISNLSAGTYTITATDNHACSATASLTITQPASALGITISSVSNVSCNVLGSATANAATGGTSPYTYSWSGGEGTNLTATNLSTGTYTITVKDNQGCTSSVSATITQSASTLGITIGSVNNVSCNVLGSLTANAATGGTSPYTYSWSGGGGTNLTAANLSAGTYSITVHDNHGCTSSVSATITQSVSTLRITIASVTNVSCYGGTGSATANTATGGNVPYTYSWNGGGGTNLATISLSSGTYIITVTDAHGCTATASASITQPISRLGITIASVTNIICSKLGSITANAATGGTASYTYSWSGGRGTNVTATSLSAGAYTITVTDNHGCTATASATITQSVSNLGITIASVNNASCNVLGSVTANAATGGTSPYTYSWSGGGGTNLTATVSAGVYTITVTDNQSCTATASATLTQPASTLGITIATVTNISCNGGSGSATANAATGGTSPYTYSWSSGGGTNLTATNLSAGTYTITAMDNHGCVGLALVIVTQPASALGVTILSVSNVSCNGGTGSATANAATGGTPPYTYIWYATGGTNLTTTVLSAGTYTIFVVDNNGCFTQASATITQPNVLTASVNGTNVSCYGGNNGSVSASPSGGTAPYTYAWNDANSQTAITATGLSLGSYIVRVTDNHGCTTTASASISQPASAVAITIASVINASCNVSGSATANTASGGTSPYTYSWTGGGGSNLTAILSSGIYTITATDNNGCTATASATITQAVSSLGITIASVVNLSCNVTAGITANAATGGAPPYTYSWSPIGGTGLTTIPAYAATYTITVTDSHGCTAIASAIITQSASSLTATTTLLENVSCYGETNGLARITASGGVSPYTYYWSPNTSSTNTASNLSGGTYAAFVIDKNGCNSSYVSVTITQPAAALSESLVSVNNATCHGGGGSAGVTASGGTPPYTYVWIPVVSTTATATGLTARSYVIGIRDANDCTTDITFSITQPYAVRDSAIKASTANVLCNGGSTGSATVGVKYGTSPFTYSWSPSGGSNITATGMSAGTYTVTVNDECGNTATAAVTITQPNVLRDSISSSSCSSGLGKATVGVKGGVAPYTYSWSPGGGSKATMSNLSPGTYTIAVTDKNGCSNTIYSTITCPPSLASPVQDNSSGNGCCPGNIENISLYPNPNTGQFTIAGIEAGMIIEVYDYTGKRISVISATNETMQVNMPNQSNGIYLIRITDKDGNLVSQKKVVKTQ